MSTYPIILYDSILIGSTLTATDTETGYSVNNLIDYRSYTWWQADTPGLKYITIDCAVATSADTLGIVGHNFDTAAAVISVESSPDNTTWTERLSEFLVTDSYAIMKTFTTASARYWRVKIQSAVIMTASSSSTGIVVADSDHIDFGTGNFFGIISLQLPDYTPDAEVVLSQKTDGANGREFTLQTNGKLRVTLNVTDYDSTVATGCTNNTVHIFGYSVTRETASVAGSIVFTVDGVQLGTTVAITAGAPATINNASSQYIMGTSTTRTAGAVYSFVIGNRALSVAEHLTFCSAGIAAADQYGSQTATYTSDFSAGVDSWTATRAAAAGNVDAIGGGNNWLSVTVDATNNTHYAEKANVFTANKLHEATVKYFIASGQTIVAGLRIYDSGGATELGTTYTTLDTATTVTFTCTPTATGLRIYPCKSDGTRTLQDVGGDDVIYVKSIIIKEIGATLALEPSGIGTADWQDSSSNNLDGAYPSGIVPLAPKMAVCELGAMMTFPARPQVPLSPYTISVEAETNQSKAGHILGSIVRYKPVQISHKIAPSESNYTWWTDTFYDFWINHGSERIPFFYAMDLTNYPDDVFWVRLADDCNYGLSMEMSGRIEAFTINMVGMLE